MKRNDIQRAGHLAEAKETARESEEIHALKRDAHLAGLIRQRWKSLEKKRWTARPKTPENPKAVTETMPNK